MCAFHQNFCCDLFIFKCTGFFLYVLIKYVGEKWLFLDCSIVIVNGILFLISFSACPFLV
jgi:hypothetical protein